MTKGSRLWLFWIVTLALAFALPVAAVEIVLGSWFFDANGLRFLNVPRNIVVQHDTSSLIDGGGIAVYRRDRYGLRGDYGVPSEIDVLAIGGSTTNEGFVSEGQTWVDVLRRELNRLGRSLNVVNAGVDGHSTVGHIRSFEVWFPRIPELRPSYVIAYVGLNDVEVEAYETYNAIDSAGIWTRLTRALKSNSALVNLYRRLRGVQMVHGSGAVTGEFVFDDPESANHEMRYIHRLGAYEGRLRHLQSLIRKFGAIPIFVTQPRGNYRVLDGHVFGLSPRAVDTYIVTRLFNDKTLKLCRETGGICIDLAAELQFEDGDFYDLNHTSPRGSEKIGSYLARKLHDLLD